MKRLRAMLVVFVALCAVVPFVAPVRAGDGSANRCTTISGSDFLKTRDAPFTATSAEIVSSDPAKPYCQVQGYVAPEISFQILLPMSGWNHGFVLVGSGGWATEKFIFLCKEPLRRGYACIAGDAGHQNGRGLWMRANPQARIDWGYRATHVTALAGKVIVQAFTARRRKPR